MCFMLYVLYFAVSATAFYEEQTVLTFLTNVLNLRNGLPRRLTDSQRRQFAKEIKGEFVGHAIHSTCRMLDMYKFFKA